ncbi:iron-containing redox enzyme family protein [Polaromonas sp.]|uniref:iron-containing redox enzyme family protein n=1 Tax=Polaromonas sp. TaxID=1869339 RepID=UPI0037518A2E
MAKEFFTEGGDFPLSPDLFSAPIDAAPVDGHDPLALHRGLAHFNRQRVAVATPSSDWRAHLRAELVWRSAEGEYLENLRATVAPLLPPAGLNAQAFVRWFEGIAQTGPGQQHPLFDWLAHTATYQDMCWFLTQEAAGEAGFDDLLAYTQVQLPSRPKLELARNYWDEMGHGKPKAMHGAMLANVVTELGLDPRIDSTEWPALALANTMLGMAASRRYTYHSIGALGAIELTAPTRVKQVSNGMRRLGMSGRVRAYFDLHAVLDVHHSQAWNAEVIAPLVEADPACGRFIAEGALMRLLCGQRCFDCYSDKLVPRH